MTELHPPSARPPAREEQRGPVPEPPAGLSRQYAIYRQAMAVCDELAATAVQGAGPGELTEVFARLIGRRVLLLDADFGLRAESGAAPELEGPAEAVRWSRSDPNVQRLLGAVRVARRPLRIPAVPGWLLDEACLVAPVAVREDTLGYLVVLDGPGSVEPDDAEFLSVTYAATLFSLTMANERTSAELDLRHQRAVVEALVHGHVLDVSDARRKAESLGLAEGQPFRVAIIRLPVDGAAQDVDLGAAERLATAVRKVAAGAAVTVREATVVAIVPEADRDAARGPAAQQTAWASALAGSTGATAGLSELVDQPEAAPRGYRQAELAIELGIRLGRAGQTVRYDDLGIYRLLFDIGDMRQLLRFAHEVIGPLLTHDRRHTVDLVQTLSVYLAQHGSLKQTARILGLHANTVAYRAQRIQALTGLDLADADDRLLAHVAVKIVEAQLTPHEQRTVEPLVP
ncbi:MAG: hypothetical protein JWR88_1396, partial [Pseudonocardia sp.]|nr:hypothetical protein [Pseudonocardia sp.]